MQMHSYKNFKKNKKRNTVTKISTFKNRKKVWNIMSSIYG